MPLRPRQEGDDGADLWWLADKGKVFDRLLPYVEKVERVQASAFDRFVKLAALYDPYMPGGNVDPREIRAPEGQMQENVIASNCDAITGTLASTDVGVRFPTDGGDWSTQRTARQLDWYAEGSSKLLDVDTKCRVGFHAGALKGTGLNEVEVDGFDRICVEPVPVDEMVVEDALVRGDWAPHVQRRTMVPRDELIAKYPQHRRAIMSAQTGKSRAWKKWAGYRPIQDQQIVVIKGWRLPIGVEGHKQYVPGRRVVCIDGLDLLDEPYHKQHYPHAVFRWCRRPGSWYGIGGAERIVGHQRKLSRRNLQMDQQHDMFARPTTWVQLPDANLAVKTMGRYAIGVYKAAKPETVIPPAISPETYKDKADTRALAFEEFGQSRMQATAMKPAGLDSGVALREHKDQTSDRFRGQEKDYERFKLDTVFLILDAAKDLGAKAPVIVHRSKFGAKKIKWPRVDMDEVRRQMAVASNLGRTPAGRRQLAMEMAQAGLISKDSAIRLAMPNATPDVEAELSIYAEALEDIEATIDEIEDGAIGVVPEPYQNLELGIWRMQMAYRRDSRLDAPEEVLEGLRQWIVLAGNQLDMAAQAAAGPVAADAGMGAPPAAAPPTGEQPVAALADQAMNLRAA